MYFLSKHFRKIQYYLDKFLCVHACVCREKESKGKREYEGRMERKNEKSIFDSL